MSLAEALLSRAQTKRSALTDKAFSNTADAAKGGLAAFLAKAGDSSKNAVAFSVASSGARAPASIQITSFHPEKTLPPANYASLATAQLIRSVRLILVSTWRRPDTSAARQPLQQLYSTANVLVMYCSAEELDHLYDSVKIEIERAVGNWVATLHSSASITDLLQDKVDWLVELRSIWFEWSDNLALVRNILYSLDRYVLDRRTADGYHRSKSFVSHDDRISIRDLGLKEFGHHILKDATLFRTFLKCIVGAIDGKRKLLMTYGKLHHDLLTMLGQLQAEDALDDAVSKATDVFYQAESTASIASLSPTEYVEYAWGRISEERDRSQWALSTGTGQHKMIAAARKQLVTQHADTILAALPDLVTSGNYDGLDKMYRLANCSDRLADLRKAFAEFIKTHGAAIVEDRERDDKMIEGLLAFKSSIDRVVHHSFGGDDDFVLAQKQGFEFCINKRENKVAELIAKYLDAKLRSGNKTMSDLELENSLDEALIIFRYTQAKDMFEEFYKRHFAKRLLLNRSASSDAERSMLLKLKAECGPEFTAKLETMIKDVEVSKDLMDEYVRFAAKQRKDEPSPKDDFDLSVSVLTQAHWPTYPNIDVALPVELAAAAERFAAFYQNRNSGRRLHWQHSLGTLTMTAKFEKAGVKELHVSTFQAIILMLFNTLEPGQKLSYADIRTHTGLNDQELKRTLQSLACGLIPTRVLRKHPQGKEVNDDDHFTFNDNFKNDRHRIRINQIQMKETAEEQKSTEQRVFLDRELILQAATVRVLKAKKTIKHSELITEVVDQIKNRFTVDVAEIKKEFEILIEKEYMERVEGQRGMYRYLA